MLAEDHRPQSFAQVVGHEAQIKLIAWTLSRPHKSGPAFLFTGPSGCGKTTLAECAAEAWGVPPWGRVKIESATCDAATLADVAAGLSQYGAGRDGHRSILIDEVHTITGRAADRLLSILEALPSHVLLCATTTETTWGDSTLRSRWTRVPLRLPPTEDVAGLLERIAAAEGLPVPSRPDWAARMVAAAGRFNIRDLINELPGKLLNPLSLVA